ncbi:MAG TPA: PaaX family transcriptional regulator C-terminal domain-containing protein [Vicinamibacterales bacterium]|nr:PaaX family transcriptional regulator C-terminal domain-containing protein [Vicinamibacterales bacterium]
MTKAPRKRLPKAASTAATSDHRPAHGADSAQALLFITLGELVWRKQETIWTSALLSGLAELGVSENAARKAIYRANQKNIIQLEKFGRQVRCSIGEYGIQVFLEGSRTVYSFRADSPDWDGRWLVVMVTVPESQREVRHYIKTRLRWTGMGSPTPGIWIAPRLNQAAVKVLEEMEKGNQIYSYHGTFGPVGNEGAMVKAAWDIDEIQRLYRNFIREFGALRPRTAGDKFRAHINLIQAWRRFPYLDPQLPHQFLPEPWIGRDAAALFHDLHNQWSAAAMQFWLEIQS